MTQGPECRVDLKDGWNVFDFIAIGLAFVPGVRDNITLLRLGMVGWILFSEGDPEGWGNIGQSMLSLFQILTLENWPQFLEAGQSIHPASWTRGGRMRG